ncbi:MAG: mechanosensitive ion channel [Nitrospirota bacterium]|nr:mechanosensitive ion channel [Nitrospirota bacterium]
MSVKEVSTDLILRYGLQALSAIVILVVGIFFAKWVGKVTHQRLTRVEMEPPVRMLLVRIVKMLILALTVMIVLDQVGVPIAPLIAGIGVAGLGVGFALQGVLSNIMAGLSIIFTKPYRVGEHISLLGVHGDVVTIDIFSTTLLHPDRSRIVIPNRKIVGEILHNFGAIRQLSLSVGVSYNTDLNQALTIAKDLLERNSRVLKEPLASVLVSQLGDSAITISVQPWVRVADYMVATGELNQAIIEQFRAAQIAIPFPQHEVRLLQI